MRPVALALTLVLVSLTWVGYLILERIDRRDDRVLLPPVAPVAPATVEALFALRLPDSTGQLRSLSQWRGKTLVVNYWATWCKPCLAEIPMLSSLAAEPFASDAQFVGIAADNAENVLAFARTTQATYPWLIGGSEAIRLTQGFGNVPQAVPFTLVIDRTGTVRAAILGAVHREALERLLMTLR